MKNPVGIGNSRVSAPRVHRLEEDIRPNSRTNQILKANLVREQEVAKGALPKPQAVPGVSRALNVPSKYGAERIVTDVVAERVATSKPAV